MAIYSPHARGLYSRNAGAKDGGGAELQTMLLATSLAERGLDVAHIVYPVHDPRPLAQPAPTLVGRHEWRGNSPLHPLFELGDVWRALSAANAQIVVVRGSGGYVVPAATWSRSHGRALVFATSNDLDFDLDRPDRRGATLRAYGVAARQSSRIVVQTEYQAQLAAQTFPKVVSTLIPSFAQLAETVDTGSEYFLWSDRMTDYKRPGKYLDLAAALPEAQFKMVALETKETSSELSREVHERAAALPNVELIARLSREQLLDQMTRATAIVKTSEVEGMPNTFLEAWARGVPVLSLSVDPNERIAKHGVGLLAGGAEDRFADYARQLWTDPQLRVEIGARGRSFVTATHSVDVVADRWSELLGELLER